MTKERTRKKATPKKEGKKTNAKGIKLSPEARAHKALERRAKIILRGIEESRTLGEHIRRLRMKMKLSQAAFAARLNIGDNFLSDLEVGKRPVGPETLRKILFFLRYSQPK